MLVGEPEGSVLEELGVGSAVGVADQPVGALDVLVGRLLARRRPRRPDGQRRLELTRLADALLAQQQRHCLALEREVRDVGLFDQLRPQQGARVEPPHRRLTGGQLVEERRETASCHQAAMWSRIEGCRLRLETTAIESTRAASCELSARELAELEARMARRPQRDLEIGLWHAHRFGAPTLAHDRDIIAESGRRWPGEAFVRRHHSVSERP